MHWAIRKVFFHVNVNADKEFIEKIAQVFLIHTYIETQKHIEREEK